MLINARFSFTSPFSYLLTVVNQSSIWWPMFIIPALEKAKQKDQEEYKASLDYVSLCLRKVQTI